MVSEAKPNWKFIDTARYGVVLVDTENMRYYKSNRNIVVFWSKLQLSPDGKKEIINIAKKAKDYNKKWIKLSYYIALQQANLATRESAITHMFLYDDNDELLTSSSTSPHYSPIIPGSVDEKFLECILEQERLGRVK